LWNFVSKKLPNYCIIKLLINLALIFIKPNNSITIMKKVLNAFMLICMGISMFSCVSKKQFASLQSQLDSANMEVGKCGESLNEYMSRLSACEQEKERLKGQITSKDNESTFRSEQINDLKAQIADLKSQRDKQVTQVGDLTVLSQTANENINETLAQLSKKDKYI